METCFAPLTKFRRLVPVFACTALVLTALPGRAALIAYWDFNNDVAIQSGSNLGILFNTASLPANNNGYGEKYETTTKTISANSGSGAAFSNGTIDMNQVTVQSAGNANGGTSGASQGWGLLLNSGLPQAPGDLTSGATNTGGSLAIFGNNAIPVGTPDAVIFSLSSTGYSGLTLSLNGRPGSTLANDPTVTWAYSPNGTTWTNFSLTGSLTAGLWGTQTATLPSALDNLSSFFLRETLVFPNAAAGSFAIDNFMLNATAVPEPGIVALLAAGMAFFLVRVGRRSRQTSV